MPLAVTDRRACRRASDLPCGLVLNSVTIVGLIDALFTLHCIHMPGRRLLTVDSDGKLQFCVAGAARGHYTRVLSGRPQTPCLLFNRNCRYSNAICVVQLQWKNYIKNNKKGGKTTRKEEKQQERRKSRKLNKLDVCLYISHNREAIQQL